MKIIAATVAAATLAIAPAMPANASDDSQGTPGFCPGPDGTTVVVDFSALGGDVIVRCAPGAQERTGSEALEDAGFDVDGTTRFGRSAVCRIEGRPAADEQLAVGGDGDYRESCVDMPPAAAYWSYWSADNGGDWAYSQYGLQSREAINGGFEGWSFALNATSADPPAPSIEPVRPDDADESGQGGSSDDEDGSSDESHEAESGEALPKPVKRDASPPPTAGTQDGVEWSGSEEQAAPDSESASAESDSNLAPWVAGGVITVLAVLIVVTAVRRRARQGDAST